MKNKALVLGWNGQVGSYLSQYLLSRGYEVYGMVRRASGHNFDFIKEMNLQDVHIVEGDLSDGYSIDKLVRSIKPTELYSLAAQSHVGTSFEQPLYTADVTGMGHLRVLEAVKNHSPETKVYFAASSEMFGSSPPPQGENTPLSPNSPYAAAKVYAYNMNRIYRESYGLFTCAGILHNHESPRRGKNFVTKKITDWIGHFTSDRNIDRLQLGNVHARRDWSHAQDMVTGMWLMLQAKVPDDYVLGSGKSHSVKDFCNIAFKEIGRELQWKGEGAKEFAMTAQDGIVIEINPKFYRPCEVNYLEADCTKARKILGWQPKISFENLVKEMVNYDILQYQKGRSKASE